MVYEKAMNHVKQDDIISFILSHELYNSDVENYAGRDHMINFINNVCEILKDWEGEES